MDLTHGITKALVKRLTQSVMQQKPVKQLIHKKTGNTYFLLNDELIECTNGREDKKYCLYANLEGMIFVREHDEFYQKFTVL